MVTYIVYQCDFQSHSGCEFKQIITVGFVAKCHLRRSRQWRQRPPIDNDVGVLFKMTDWLTACLGDDMNEVAVQHNHHRHHRHLKLAERTKLNEPTMAPGNEPSSLEAWHTVIRHLWQRQIATVTQSVSPSMTINFNYLSHTHITAIQPTNRLILSIFEILKWQSSTTTNGVRQWDQIVTTSGTFNLPTHWMSDS